MNTNMQVWEMPVTNHPSVAYVMTCSNNAMNIPNIMRCILNTKPEASKRAYGWSLLYCGLSEGISDVQSHPSWFLPIINRSIDEYNCQPVFYVLISAHRLSSQKALPPNIEPAENFSFAQLDLVREFLDLCLAKSVYSTATTGNFWWFVSEQGDNDVML